ncbi:MAG TPA: NAD(P)(+) transhydrogenase (Re/Si-specific) subunit beta, partial [Pseudomonadales bacterium]|nr:NAD(P)(+) transhydrogenase (Re/Si-specific) subunit beta [Pseudomonadales bacterium]
MAIGYIIVSYLGAAVLFILSLGGLSKQETSRRGNIYGVLGMAIAIAATVLGVHIGGLVVLIPAILIGAAIGGSVA